MSFDVREWASKISPKPEFGAQVDTKSSASEPPRKRARLVQGDTSARARSLTLSHSPPSTVLKSPDGPSEQLASVTTPTTSLPLTSTNLKKHTSSMPGPTQTPPRSLISSSSNALTTPQTKGIAYGELSSVHTSYVASKHAKDISAIGEKMANHGLLFNNRDSFERYPEFKEEVFQIIEAPAVKNPEPSSEKKFNITHQEYERSNENTFFHVAMPILMKDGHFVLEDGKAAYKDFLVDEGIRVNIDREFRGMLLPHRYRDPKFDKELSEALRKNDGMKNSKPDWCMGMSLRNCRKLAADRTAMPTPLPSHLSNLLTISQEMYHPFFLAEAKADGRPTADAVDQARCGGATIVNADCVLTDLILHEWEPRSYETEKQPITHARQHVTKPVQNPAQSLSTGAMQSGQIEDQQVHPMLERPLGADPHTMIFSATVKPDLVTVYVHWRERVLFPDGTIDSLFHMNTVFSQSNHDERRALRDIRRVFHNIIKWGIGPRLDEHLEMWDGIREYAVWYQTEELPRQLELQKGNKKAQARGKKRAFESDEASVAAKKVLLEVNLEESVED